jgi:hypothetical protein
MAGMICLVHSPGDVVIAAGVSAGTFALTNIPILAQYWTDFGSPRLGLPNADELVILILFVRSSPEVSVSHTAHFGGQCLIATIPAAIVVHCASMLPIIDGSDIAVLVVGGSAGSIIYLLILRPVRIDIVSLAADLRHLRWASGPCRSAQGAFRPATERILATLCHWPGQAGALPAKEKFRRIR